MADIKIPRTDDLRENQSWQLRLEQAKQQTTQLQADIAQAQTDLAQLQIDIAAAEADINNLNELTSVIQPIDPNFQLQIVPTATATGVGVLFTKSDKTTRLGGVAVTNNLTTGDISMVNAHVLQGNPSSAYVAVHQDNTVSIKASNLIVGSATDHSCITLYDRIPEPTSPPSASSTQPQIFCKRQGSSGHDRIHIKCGSAQIAIDLTNGTIESGI